MPAVEPVVGAGRGTSQVFTDPAAPLMPSTSRSERGRSRWFTPFVITFVIFLFPFHGRGRTLSVPQRMARRRRQCCGVSHGIAETIGRAASDNAAEMRAGVRSAQTFDIRPMALAEPRKARGEGRPSGCGMTCVGKRNGKAPVCRVAEPWCLVLTCAQNWPECAGRKGWPLVSPRLRGETS
jgi:hypothetical protein